MTALGIDFGTGNSVLAEWRGAEASVFSGVGEGGAVRSDLVVAPDGSISSNPAVLLALPSGAQIERAIKRRLMEALEKGDAAKVEQLRQLAMARLKYIYDSYLAVAGAPVVKAVLTCPANTGQAYRNLLLEIGRQIGLPAVDIVDEPTAAAVHHGLKEKAAENERWMVVDWGCGTCDVSLITRRAGSRDLVVESVEGDNALGGMDIDCLLREALAKKFKFQEGAVDLYAVEDLKKRLSGAPRVSVSLGLSSGKSVVVEYRREELDVLTSPLLARCEALIASALKKAKWESVDHVIATGGPMLMPAVMGLINRIADKMGAELLADDPLTSVSLGAARLAEVKRSGGTVVTNKVAKSIGLRIFDSNKNDAYHKVICRGEDRPVRRSVTLATSVDLQDVIEIEIREGDNDASAEANSLLARLNAVVRPESKGLIKIKLDIALTESSEMEAFIAAVGDVNAVRDVEVSGIRLAKDQRETASAELRASDPLSEFKEQVVDRGVDPDTARQAYERLKIKYHPDRDPAKRDYWMARLAALDGAFSEYNEEVERRMRASSVPALPWDNKAELEKMLVDDVLAQRLTHCLANGIGSEEQRRAMPGLLKRYPDYRRVLASYLFGMKRNPALQNLLSEDDRPHVGLVVLLQNIPGKPIRERHEVLKAAYRIEEKVVHQFLREPNLNCAELYEKVRNSATPGTAAKSGGRGWDKTTVPAKIAGVAVTLTYEGSWTWIYDLPAEQPGGVKVALKKLRFKYSGKRSAFFADRKVLPTEFA